jgi:hypothetical protein
MYNRDREREKKERYKEETMFTGFAGESQQQNRFQRLKDLIDKVKKGKEKESIDDDDEEKIDFLHDAMAPSSSKGRRKIDHESPMSCDTPRALERPEKITDPDDEGDSFWDRVTMVVTDSVDLSLAAYELIARAA